MSKKILILFAMLLSVMVFAPSCSSNEKKDSDVKNSNESVVSDDVAADKASDKTSDQAPVSLEDAKVPKDKDFTYSNYGSYVEISGYQGKDEVIIVPNTIEGVPATIREHEFIINENSNVRGIVFDEGFTEIPHITCVSEDTKIEAIKLPSTCEMGDYFGNPFTNLPYLKNVEVAEGNQELYVEDGSLYGIYGGEYKGLLLYSPTKEDEVFYQPDGTYLADRCFLGNKYLKRVENAKAWHSAIAFEESNIEEIVCSDAWTCLDQHQFEDFSGNSKLRSITLSVNLDSLVWKVHHFAGLDSLEEIIVPEGNPKFFSDDGVLYYVGDEATYLLKYPNARPDEEYTVSEKADTIYYVESSFENPIYLKKLHVDSKWEDWAKNPRLPNGIEVVVD